jgi:type III restriction enzyme
LSGSDEFTLFPFQEEAAEALRAAALDWVAHVGATGVPRYGPTPIPFLGQLKAVTGAGKTPILADIVSGLGDGVALWTSRSSAVVEQTFQNLRGRYRNLLPQHDVKVIREIPSQAEWQDLLTATRGLTIWLLTTASWNEAEAAKAGGDIAARLSLHRPHPDWSGPQSPWELLRISLRRPLWIVSDESHNQSSVQLDLLAALQPIGFFMASATPVQNELFTKWQDALAGDDTWKALAAAGTVAVRTRDVVAAELLKTTIELYDFHSGVEENVDAVLDALDALDSAVGREGASVQPKAIYVVEKSNPTKGSTDEARPVTIWRYLRAKGVPAEQIAVYTDTRDLPDEAERISSLTKLQPRHRHIIFNQALQEGWDDPEAYVAYFDGTTKSFIRIRQIVGRILRQPRAQHYASERLNTATVLISTPTDTFDQVLSDLQTELRLYAPEDEPTVAPIRVRTRKNPLLAIPPKPIVAGFALPRRALKAPDMSAQVKRLRSRGASPWDQEFLEATGIGRLSVVSLAAEDVIRTEYLDVLRSARTPNAVYLRRRLLARNRACVNAIHPDAFSGPAYEQLSCQNSQAQQELSELAGTVADYYEDRVVYEIDPDPDRAVWRVGEHRPRSGELVEFRSAAHPTYSRADFNGDEILFAQALDNAEMGVWMRNTASAELGFGIPLPIKVGDSTRFYPDFLWWIDGVCWAIDTTGRHLLSDKVRGKLIGLEQPKVALVVRGQIDLPRGVIVDRSGWTVVLARAALAPVVEHSDDLQHLLKLFAA